MPLKPPGSGTDNSPVEFPTDYPGDQRIAHHNGHAPAATGDDALARAREEQLRRLLGRLETGGLDAYEYARRVRALDSAASPEAMAEIVDAESAEPKLDPVDLAILARGPVPARGVSPALMGRHGRSTWIVMLAVFFVALLGLGMWLVSRAHSLNNSGGSGAVAPAGVVWLGAGASGL